MEFRDEVDVAAPAEIVWDLTIDVERWPSMMETLHSVELLERGAIARGTRARIRQPGMPVRIWTVTEVDAPHRFLWGTRLFGVQMDAIHEVTSTPTGCRNALAIHLHGRGSGLLAKLSAKKLQATLATENRAFRENAEARVNGAPSQ